MAMDVQIIQLLAERMQLVECIGKIKNEQGILIEQAEYWKQTCEQRNELAEKLDLDPKLVKSIFEEIHKTSITKQSNV